jgi:hypothetical protein
MDTKNAARAVIGRAGFTVRAEGETYIQIHEIAANCCNGAARRDATP